MKVSVTVIEFVLAVVGIVVVAGALYFVAIHLFGPGEPTESAGEQVPNVLPESRALTADDLRATTFAVTARGYRMSDVDALMERLASQLHECRCVAWVPEPHDLGGEDNSPDDTATDVPGDTATTGDTATDGDTATTDDTATGADRLAGRAEP